MSETYETHSISYKMRVNGCHTGRVQSCKSECGGYLVLGAFDDTFILRFLAQFETL